METNKDLLPAKELERFLKSNLKPYTNKERITLEFVNGTGITAASGLGFVPGIGYTAMLLTDPVEPVQFIESYKLKSIKDLDKIAQGFLWIRYLIGKAAVSYEVPELEATFTFRVVNSKTVIYCYACHFYDQSDVLFTMEHHFRDYLRQNWARLEMAVQRRMEWV